SGLPRRDEACLRRIPARCPHAPCDRATSELGLRNEDREAIHGLLRVRQRRARRLLRSRRWGAKFTATAHRSTTVSHRSEQILLNRLLPSQRALLAREECLRNCAVGLGEG